MFEFKEEQFELECLHDLYLHYSGGSDTNPLLVCKRCGNIIKNYAKKLKNKRT